MARRRSPKKVPAPPTALAERLEDAAAYTARYDAPTDWADGRSTMTEKLIRSAGVVRYWQAGPLFRRRMTLSALCALVIIVGWFVLFSLVA